MSAFTDGLSPTHTNPDIISLDHDEKNIVYQSAAFTNQVEFLIPLEKLKKNFEEVIEKVFIQVQ